jgi:hypothetical protein
VQVGEHPLGLWQAIGNDDQEACREAARERRHDDGIGGAGQASREELTSWRGKRIDEARERGQAFDRVEQGRK